jgi:hypothetical protein
MSDTVLEHPLVREYLRELDRASLTLPAAQARELREQIAAHLDEALPPGATPEQVSDEIDRLGDPRTLAAAAAGPASRTLAARARVRLARVRWWTWAALAVLVPALGTGAGFLISMNSAPALIASGEIGWLYPADRDVQVETTADAVTQTAVPYRFGQRQGIMVNLVNESDWTQQIVGIGPRWTFGSLPGTAQVSVESGPDLNVVGIPAAGTRSDFALPGVIPPHSARLVHVSWISDMCYGAGAGGGPGSGIIVDHITLEVRVGLITKTEDIPLQQAFELTPPKHSITRNCS